MQPFVARLPMCPPAGAADIAAPRAWASWRLASRGDTSKQGATREDGATARDARFEVLELAQPFVEKEGVARGHFGLKGIAQFATTGSAKRWRAGEQVFETAPTLPDPGRLVRPVRRLLPFASVEDSFLA